jgi:hypothetical protein
MLGSPDPLGGEPFPDKLLRFGCSSPTAAGSPTWTAIPTSRRSCRPTGGLPADTLLRLTIEFADGRSVSNADSRTAGPPDAKRRAEHQLGSRRVVSGRLVPRHAIPGPALPSSGPLAFTCTWPARGIPASRVEVDGAAIRRAADVAVTLWPDDPYCSHD